MVTRWHVSLKNRELARCSWKREVSEEWIYSGAILDLCDGLSQRHHVPKWYHDNVYPLQGPHDSRANPETEANPPE